MYFLLLISGVFGDCDSSCLPSSVRPIQLGNAQCDSQCYNEACGWDLGDCEDVDIWDTLNSQFPNLAGESSGDLAETQTWIYAWVAIATAVIVIGFLIYRKVRQIKETRSVKEYSNGEPTTAYVRI